MNRKSSNEQDNQRQHGYPIAHPIATSKKPPFTPVNTHLVSPNDGAHAGTTAPQRRGKQRVNARGIDELADWLSERDLAILRSVAEHYFLTARHVEALHFANHAPVSGSRIARRALARLRDLRLLGALDRHIGGLGRGSEGLVHYVDIVGDQLLSARSGRRTRRFHHEPSRRFVRHTLAIADTRLALIQANREGQLGLADSTVEPASWRRFTGLGGARLTLKPDLYLETAVASDSDLVHAWFVEVDLGTETIPTLLKKCADYETYRRTGLEQAHGGGFPVVVWSVAHADPAKAERRRQALREAIDRDRTLTPALFRIVAPDQLMPLLARGGAA